MCELRPPVTLWGTTQVTSLATILSTAASDGAVSTITHETVITNVIPVQTRSYPCTSTSTSPSSTPTQTPRPSPDPPEAEPTSVQESRAAQSSSSPAEISESPTLASEGTSDFLTISTTRSRSTSIISASTSSLASTSQVTEPPRKPHSTIESEFESSVSPSGGNTEVSASSILASSTSSTSIAAGGSDSTSSATEKHGGLSTNAIAGIVSAVVIVFIFSILFLLKRRLARKRQSSEGDRDPYWERRFEELESRPKLESTLPSSPSDGEGTWRKHLTLNLGSHHSMIARPASRLSQISSFFGQKSPEPSRANLLPDGGAEGIDFSHAASGSDSRGGRASSPQSSQSRISTSTKSKNGSSKEKDKRTSAWPFGSITAAIAGIKRNSDQSGDSRRDHLGRNNAQRQGSSEGRRGKEWIRTIVSSDSGFGLNLDPHRPRSQSPMSRGLPPPPRSRGVSPMPLKTVVVPHTNPNSVLSPDIVSPNPPPSYDWESQGESILSPQEGPSGSRQLYPSRSLKRNRVNKGLAVPEIALSTDAVSPALWVDGDPLDSSDTESNKTARPLPPIPPLPSVAPLAIAKRSKPAPSAFNPLPNADLISKFSPDSSRASFSTKHESVPAPPARDSDRDSIASRRTYDRSAVTPQLPTLAICADSFRAEMAEISASTGDDREERVISFHGGRSQGYDY